MSAYPTLPDGWQAANDCLRGKVILITGAGDGIGRACALAFGRLGATVVLLGRTQEKLEAVYDEIKNTGGATPAMVPLNLAAAGAREFAQLADMLDAEFHKLDGIVHCAAQLGDITPLELYAPETWAQVMQVNLTAPFLLTQAMMPLLKAAPSASVVFVSSSVGRKGRAFWGAYAVSKAGLENLAQVFADENEHLKTLRFNALNPGATRTVMRAKAYPAENPATVKTADAVTPTLAWLLCDDSLGINGRSFDTLAITPP
jgi:NAD(P)-dependent dehydrogenase (short-subunit alcohol dehydrogenase family)